MIRTLWIDGPRRRASRLMVVLAALGPLASPSPAFDPGGFAREGPGRHERMDYGRSLMATIKAPTHVGNVAMKGIAIRLGPGDGTAASVCFDTDLLRISAGWTGGFLKLSGVAFDGTQGTNPEARGTPLFATRPGPGWANQDGDLKDPRREPYGPLPGGWAKYKGLYRSGDRVVLSYSVGGAQVLEMPWIEGRTADPPAITRTFNVGPTSRPITLVALDMVPGGNGGGIGLPGQANPTAPEGPALGRVAVMTRRDKATFAMVVGVPGAATWKVVDGKSRLLLTLPASKVPVAFQLIVGPGTGTDAARFASEAQARDRSLDLARYTGGGPSKWPDKVATRGVLGQGDGPYVVDTLTAPDENPYRSWIRFGGMDFFAGGKSAALSTWSGDVWIVGGVDDKLERLTWKRFAAGLHQPLGLKIVDEKVYVLGRDGITRLHDLDGDGEADYYEAFNHDMAVTAGFHEFAFDLQTDPEGNFYFAKAAPVRAGGTGFETIAANSGTLMKVSKDGKALTTYATGFRAPNGISVGPEGQVTSGDNEGTWMPKCRLNLVKPGGFYGVVDTSHRDEKPTMYDEPICWFPKDVDNSGGGQAWVTSDRWGPFAGRLLHTSYGTCSLYLALIDRQDDHIQGGVVRFPVNFLSGIMRPRFNAVDGQLYIAGLRGWQSSAASDACFQRVRYTGKPANMATGLKVTKAGLDLSFTDPLDPEDANDPDSYDLQQWNYLWCGEYGSDDYSAKTPDFEAKVRELNRLRLDPVQNQLDIERLVKLLAKGRDKVTVESAKISAEGKTISLEIKDLKPSMQMLIKCRLKAVDGRVVHVQLYGTINFVPH